jgi:flagellar hook assembly protein FlgD
MANPVSATAAASTINAGIGTLAQNYETFLHLLTTQLKNQDPLSPLDTNQFTQQLTAMTGVQQQLLTNQLLTQIIGQNQADLGGSAVNLIGKTVTVETANTSLVDGAAEWTYRLDRQADHRGKHGQKTRREREAPATFAQPGRRFLLPGRHHRHARYNSNHSWKTTSASALLTIV